MGPHSKNFVEIGPVECKQQQCEHGASSATLGLSFSGLSRILLELGSFLDSREFFKVNSFFVFSFLWQSRILPNPKYFSNLVFFLELETKNSRKIRRSPIYFSDLVFSCCQRTFQVQIIFRTSFFWE